MDNGWNVIVEQFFPTYRAVACESSELDAVTSEVDHVRRVSVGPHKPKLNVTREVELIDANPDRLWMLVGKLSDEGLREAFITGGTDDSELLTTWRALLRRANSEMHAGARVRGVTGETTAAPRHRHTIGAHRLAESGVTMLAIAGSVRYEFDDVVVGDGPPWRSAATDRR
jgi:hypothetical protein